MDETLFAVKLTEEALAASNARAVLRVICGLLMRQDVSQGSICRQVQPPNLVVDLSDRAKLSSNVHVGFDVDRLEAFGKTTRLGSAVILHDMLARPCDGQ